MNQILDYIPDSGRPNRSGGSDKVVRVFAIILILFALGLIGVVSYGLISNKEEIKNDAVEETHANIEVDINGTEATISVTHDKNIQKLIYSWNTTSERKINEDGKSVEEKIDIPAGENTLHIKVIDENGVETTYDEEISSERGIDIINPVIELEPINKKLKITATDETAMDFLTYRWNDGEEEKVYADENSKEISIEIDVLKGQNDLIIVAVDGSNNTVQEQKKFIGLTKPEIKVTLSEDGSSVNIKAEHENGIEEVLFNFNNVDYNVDLGGETPKTIEFDQNLAEGVNNRIILTIKSVDGTESKFDANCTYGEGATITRNDEETTQSSENNNENGNNQESNRENSDNNEENENSDSEDNNENE